MSHTRKRNPSKPGWVALTMEREYRRECTGKRAYRTKNVARQAASQLRKATGQTDKLDAYKCPTCGSYHIGHNRATGRGSRS